ncbi:MAG TPA: nucleotide exchange factor GrpE [Jiangellaceae bacterium]
MTAEEPNDGPVVRDRRRIDPKTGERREAPPGSAAGAPAERVGGGAGSGPAGDDTGAAADAATSEALAAAEALAAERLDQLKRVQAEYVNYRRRVERDRDLVRENAVASVLGELLGVLDDIGRARDHGDLTGAFRSVGEAIEGVTAKLGLERYGEPGDEFDPTIHEALMHEYSDEVTSPTCTKVLMPGYRFGERVIRAARVAVAEPTEALPETEAEPEADAEPAAATDAETEETTDN